MRHDLSHSEHIMRRLLSLTAVKMCQHRNILEEKLAACRSYEECFRVSLWLRERWSDDWFLPLLHLTLNARNPYAQTMAAACLAMLEPKSPLSCEQLLRHVQQSRWSGDTAAVPLYLISQFGRPAVSEAVQQLQLRLPELQKSKSSLARVEYWLRFTALDMSELLVYWQWEEERLSSSSKI